MTLMNPRIAKNIRLVRPAWLLAVGLLIVAAFLPSGAEWATIVVIFACPIIAAAAFGGEFAHGTISQLLTQPVDRRRVWFDKMLVTGAALGSLLLIMVAIARPSWPVTVVAACAFCTIPFFTLVGRNTLSGVILSIPIPGLLFVIGAALALWLLRSGGLDTVKARDAFDEQRLTFWTRAYLGVVLPAYCAIVYVAGYRYFRRLEVTNLIERQLRLPGRLPIAFQRLAGHLLPIARHPIRALIGRELHFQSSTLTVFVMFAVLQLLAVIYIKLGQPRDPEPYFIVPLVMYAVIMPLVIGSSAIAEERNLGTRAWHLTLPISARAQWFVKLGVVLFSAALFGLVPVAWLFVNLPSSELLPDLPELFPLFTAVLFLTLIAFYASSFSRDSTRALLATVGLVLAMGLIGAWLGALLHWTLISPDLLLSFSTPAVNSVLKSPWFILGLPLLCFLVLLMIGSFKHFSTLDHSRTRICANILLVFLPPLFLLFLLVHLARAATELL